MPFDVRITVGFALIAPAIKTAFEPGLRRCIMLPLGRNKQGKDKAMITAEEIISILRLRASATD
ncbi:MAG: hypothetical protein ACE5EM_12715 [Sphingomonadales bacterium]